jgi:hypothetical protein
MPEVAFTCSCKCLFNRYIRDGEPWMATCPLCGEQVQDGIGPQIAGMKVNPLRLPGDQYDYVSAVDGSHISSKRAHREHLKRHALIEVGNEKGKPHEITIPKDSIRAEMRNQLERMRSHGTWRDR